MISVVLADDQPLIRSALSRLIEQEPDLQLVASAPDGRSAVAAAVRTTPDVVILDIRMPDVDGIRACQLIRAEPSLTATRVLMLTTFEDEENVVKSIRAGASGFIGKASEPAEIFAAIRAVARGEALLSPRAAHALITRFVESSGDAGTEAEDLDSLTPRERGILVLVAEGMSNEQIATSLSISRATVKTHVNRAMVKLSAHSRAQLVIIALRHGLRRAPAAS